MLIAIGAPGQAANTCKPSAQKGRMSRLLGGLGEGLINAGMGKLGISEDASYRNTMRDMLSTGIACALTDGELKRAEAAQNTSLNSKKVGAKSTSSWTSTDRPGVSGGTTVVSRSVDAGRRCAVQRSFFTDADGKETSVEKEVCENPGGGWTAAT